MRLISAAEGGGEGPARGERAAHEKLKPRIATGVGRGQNAKPGMILRVHREIAEKERQEQEERKKFAPIHVSKDEDKQQIRPLGKKAAKYARVYKRLQQQQQQQQPRRPSFASVSSLGAEQSVGSSLVSLMAKARKLSVDKKKAKKRPSQTSDLGFDLPPDYPGFEEGSAAQGWGTAGGLRGAMRGAHVPPRMYLRRREAYALLPGTCVLVWCVVVCGGVCWCAVWCGGVCWCVLCGVVCGGLARRDAPPYPRASAPRAHLVHPRHSRRPFVPSSNVFLQASRPWRTCRTKRGTSWAAPRPWR